MASGEFAEESVAGAVGGAIGVAASALAPHDPLVATYLASTIAPAITPTVQRVLAGAMEIMGNRRLDRAAVAVNLASEQLAKTPDEVVKEALSDGRSERHLRDGILASANATSDGHLRLYARLLAEGLEGRGAGLDRAGLLLRVMADLDDRQIVLLHEFTWITSAGDRQRPPTDAARLSAMERMGLVVDTGPQRQFRQLEFELEHMALPPGGRAALRQAPNHYTPINHPAPFWDITPLGLEVLRYVEEARIDMHHLDLDEE